MKMQSPKGTRDYYPAEMAWRARVELVDSLIAVTGGQSPVELILDLGEVDFLNSAGVGAIFSVRKHVIDGGGRMVACNAKPVIQRLLATVKQSPFAAPRSSLAILNCRITSDQSSPLT